MGSPVQLLHILKSINFTSFVNQHIKLEEENLDYLMSLAKQQKIPPCHQGSLGHPRGLTWWALVVPGSSSGTLRGRGCGVCTGATLCIFFCSGGTTEAKVGRYFFFLGMSPGKERKKETETRDWLLQHANPANSKRS